MTHGKGKALVHIDRAHLPVAALAVVAFSLPSMSTAQVNSASFGVGVGASDNIGRVPDDGDSETMYALSFDLDLLDEDGRLHSEVDSQLEYIDYASDTFDSEVTGALNAFFELSLVPGRFYWLLRNNFGQRQQDPFAPSTPANREYVNFFSTGPTLDLIDSARNIARLQLVYSRIDFEESPSDNERYGGAIQFGRVVRRDHTLSLIGSTETVDFADDTVGTDFDRNQAYIKYEGVGVINEIVIDVGYTEIDNDIDEESDAILFRLDWTKQLSPNATWRLFGGRDFSDEGSMFRLFQEELGNLNVTTSSLTNPNPFLNHYLSTSFNYAQGSAATSILLAFNQADFEDNDNNDRDTFVASFALQGDLGARVFAGLRLEGRVSDFTSIDRKTEVFVGALTLGYRIGPYTDLSLQYQYTTRNDTVPSSEYDENRYFLRASYTPGWAR